MKTPINLVMAFAFLNSQTGVVEIVSWAGFVRLVFSTATVIVTPGWCLFQMRVLGMCISGKNTIRYSLRSIQIIFENCSIKNPSRKHAPRIHAHTMTQGEAFMICTKSICLFQQLRHQHSTSKLFQRGLRQQIAIYLFNYLFILLNTACMMVN